MDTGTDPSGSTSHHLHSHTVPHACARTCRALPLPATPQHQQMRKKPKANLGEGCGRGQGQAGTYHWPRELAPASNMLSGGVSGRGGVLPGH